MAQKRGGVVDPFLVQGPACISFSGGRTSAYMLWRILQAHGGGLPDDVHVLFANTGKERVETLDFVQACADAWRVRVRWIEYHHYAPFIRWTAPATFEAGDLFHTFREVDYQSASRCGEPFDALIRARRFLPNPVMRICTQELKIRPMKSFARVALGFDYWTNIVGLRADEPRRVAKTTAPTKERWENECPLARAGVTEQEVLAHWAGAPFDLQLQTHEGNCDLCYLKGRSKIERIMRVRPDLVPWWSGHETDAMRFRRDRPSYARMLDMVQRSPLLPGFDDDDTMPCACTD